MQSGTVAIHGVGVDILDIERVERSMQRPRFLARNFGEEERAQLAARGNPPPSVTANFCAKEAFAKALGTGVRGFSLVEVQLLRAPSGKPYLKLDGEAARLARGLRFSVSLSHTDRTAIAFVVAERVAIQNEKPGGTTL